MRPTKLLIFGSPKAGTPLMLAAPRIAIDLRLKILVWEDNRERLGFCYNATSYYLRTWRDLPTELLQNIAGIEALGRKAAE